MSEWWRGAVIYQVYPRSFQDSTGDGIGDLKGITERLDHVAGLGVDAVWLSPVFASPMADMGYDVSDYTDIDPLFGTLADFDALVARAHDLGLKIIIDQVVSHTSDQHPWFKQSRLSASGEKADWYVWADANEDGTPPTNWLAVFGGPAWEWDTRRRQYYLHNFLSSQPDLNYHNPAVQDAILETMRFWLDRGVDGFRLDTVNYYFHDRYLRDNPHAPRDFHHQPNPAAVNPYGMQEHVFSKNRPENIGFLKRMRKLLDEYENTTLVGEVGDDHHAVEIMGAYTKGRDRLHMAYSFELLGPQFTARHFRSCIEDFFAGAPDGWPCWSFSNHDVERHVGRWLSHAADHDALARQAAALLLSLPGSICIYQGEEMGLTDTELSYDELTDPRGKRFWPEDKGRDGCRTPMVWDGSAAAGFTTGLPWLPIKDPQRQRNVEALAVDPESVLHFYRDMIAARTHSGALFSGETAFYDLPEPVLGFVRTGDDETMACVFNLSADAIELQLDGGGALLAVSRGADLAAGTLSLAANGFALLKAPSGAPPVVHARG